MSPLLTAAALIERLPRPLRRHRLMTAWMRLTGEPALQLVRIRDKSYGYADMSDGFLRLIPIEGDYEKDFFAVADAVMASGGTFLDCGANHGLLSFGLAGRHGSKIDFHLFEPNPKLVRSIEKTKALYPGMRMTLNAVAVSEIEGVVSFAIEEVQTGQSHISAEGDGVEVPCITLDAYIEERQLPRVDLLKLDVEGYELAALRGAYRALQRRTIQAVYFEYFEKYLVRVSPPEELIRYLDTLGFEVCFCRPCDYEPRGGATHDYLGLAMLPVAGHTRPAMTDLLAVHKECLTPR
jgi:FkbM family methyltransferase